MKKAERKNPFCLFRVQDYTKLLVRIHGVNLETLKIPQMTSLEYIYQNKLVSNQNLFVEIH